MRYRISQIKLNPGDSEEALKKAIQRKVSTGRQPVEIRNLTIVKESIDARKKPDVKLVYTADFDTAQTLGLPEAKTAVYQPPFSETELDLLRQRSQMQDKRPVVTGYGPAGIFAGLLLAEWGMRPIILERGEPVEERIKTVEAFWETGVLNRESNVQFGEGGAGTFSDGKLTTGIKDIRIRRVLEEFVRAGADPVILYKQKPHIGTDQLRDIVRNIRERTKTLGGEFRFHTRLEGIVRDEAGHLCGVRTLDNRSQETAVIPTDRMILATGHSARDTFQMMLEEGAHMEQKPFSIGVRIEHPQAMIDQSQYGSTELASLIGHADYKLNYRCEDGRGVYTFCMCPGGQVINSASEDHTVVTNGMSCSARDSGTANSGLLVDVRVSDFASDHPLAGLEFQRVYEQKAYQAASGGSSMPMTTYGRFRTDEQDAVRNCLPAFAAEAIIEAMPHLGKKLRGFDRDDSRMIGVETRSSSPVRIRRNAAGECSIGGIFPAGEGPGYAGGIMSAAVDGMKAAEKLARGALTEEGV